MATKKERFADRVLELNEHCIALLDAIPEFENTYFDETWNSGGGDEIVNADVSSRNITAAEIGNFVTMAQQLKNFFGNSAVTTGDYAATVNVMRHAGS